ncbi:MAG: tRNA 2-thiocytidine(32) synthetase TtcA [Gammaproteobacteria bacterium]|nr:tRNA 2-thiocytidine(32) synthetase TtcA [Gammaproteobacteria bacterium]
MSPDSVAGRRLEKKLLRATGRAISEFGMIADGDRVMVCLSGGKDSYTLLDMLLMLQSRAPIRFSLTAVNLDQKQPGFPGHVLPDYLASRGVDYHILEQDTYSVVREKIPAGKTMCSLCSRLRRGVLYSFAVEQGYSKIALGHHLDDALETLFLNLFHGGHIKSMPPKLLSDDGRNLLIRPLYHCRERDIEKYAEMRAFPIIPCNLCGSQDGLRRARVKAMLGEWEREDPSRIASLATALSHVEPSQLADSRWHDFKGLDNLLVRERTRRRA